jgi:hypothetical protein
MIEDMIKYEVYSPCKPTMMRCDVDFLSHYWRKANERRSFSSPSSFDLGKRYALRQKHAEELR